MAAVVVASRYVRQVGSGSSILKATFPAFVNAQVGDRIVFLTYGISTRTDLFPTGVTRFATSLVQGFYRDLTTAAHLTAAHEFSADNTAVAEVYGSAHLIRGADLSLPPALSVVGDPSDFGDYPTKVTSHPGVTTRRRNSLLLWQQRTGGLTTTLIPDQPAGWTDISDTSQRMRMATATRTFPAQAPTGPVAVQAQIQSADYLLLLELVERNDPPYAPGITLPLSVDRTADLVVPLDFQDPNAGDSPSRSTLYLRRMDVTPVPAWSSITRQSPISSVTVPAGTLVEGNYEFQAEQTDALGLLGARSGSVYALATTPPAGPVFTDPVPGETIGASSRTFTVSVPQLVSLEWRVFGDIGGEPDPDVVIDPGALINDPAARTFTATGLPNGTSVHAQARAWNNGLPGPWVSTFNPVQFTAPRKPLTGLTVGPGEIVVYAANPAPTGSQPRVSFHYLHRRTLDAAGQVLEQGRLRDLRLGGPLMVPPGGLYRDGTVASRTGYAYAHESVGENGTSVMGDWVSVAAGQPDLVEPEQPTGEGRFADSRFSTARFD